MVPASLLVTLSGTKVLELTFVSADAVQLTRNAESFTCTAADGFPQHIENRKVSDWWLACSVSFFKGALHHEKLVPKDGSECSPGNRWNWVCHQKVRQRNGRPGKQASGRVGQED